jgi:hypothetical protein
MVFLKILVLLFWTAPIIAETGALNATRMVNPLTSPFGITGGMSAKDSPLEQQVPRPPNSGSPMSPLITATTCGDSPFWTSWASQLSGENCSKKVKAAILGSLPHIERNKQLKTACDCFFSKDNLMHEEFKRVRNEVRSTPVEKNAKGVNSILRQMRAGMMLQASLLAKTNDVAMDMAMNYSQSFAEKDNTDAYKKRIQDANDFFKNQDNPNLRKVSFDTSVPSMKDVDMPVPKSCATPLMFVNYQQIPKSDSSFYQSLKEHTTFDQKNWNFQDLMTDFNQRASQFGNLTQALSNPGIKSIKDRLDFLKRNPLYMNLFASTDPTMLPAQKKLFGAVQSIYNSSKCSTGKRRRKCIVDKLNDHQSEITTIFQDDLVKQAVNKNAVDGLDSFLGLLKTNKDILETSVVSDFDLDFLAKNEIGGSDTDIKNRVSICENIQATKTVPVQSIEKDGPSQPYLDLQAEWASKLSLENLSENPEFKDYDDKLCKRPRKNKDGISVSLTQHMDTKCPVNVCSPEQYRKIFDDFTSNTQSVASDPNDTSDDLAVAESNRRRSSLTSSDYTWAAETQTSLPQTYRSAPVSNPEVFSQTQQLASVSPMDFEVARETAAVSGAQNFSNFEMPLPNAFVTPPQTTTMAAPLSPSSDQGHIDRNIEETRASIKDTEREAAAASADTKKVKDLEDQLVGLRDQLKKLEQSRLTETVVSPVATASAAVVPNQNQPAIRQNVSAYTQNTAQLGAQPSGAAQSFASSVSAPPSASNFANSQTNDSNLGSAKSSGSSAQLSGASLGKALGTGGSGSGLSFGSTGANSIYVVNSPTALTVSSDSSTPSQDLAITVSSQEYQTLEGFRQGTTTQLDPQLIEKLQAQLGTIPTSKINLSFTAPDGQILKFDVTKGENGLAFLPLDASGRAPASAAQPVAPAKQSKLYQNLLNTLDNSAR